ncbi:MAG: hypothetical protein KC635_25940, partial [Myxococcales bacterium]|nr:hypothetical protein [Myxococcales bacterium]
MGAASARTFGTSPLLASVVCGIGLFGVAFPAEPTLLGAAFALGFAAVHAGAFYLAYRSRAVLTATFVTLFALANGATLGDGVQSGLARSGLYVDADSVQFAVVMDCLFVLVAVLVSLLAQRRTIQRPAVPGPNERSFIAAFLVVIGASAAAAFASGTWTSWGGAGHDAAQASGSIRLELIYPALLFAASGLGISHVVGSTSTRRWRALRLAGALTLA